MPAIPSQRTRSIACRSRPDWIVLVYPGWAPGTLDLSKVPQDLPPTFLVCTSTGDVFHAKQTVEFYNALFEVGRSMKPKPLNIEMHIYGEGKHASDLASAGNSFRHLALPLAEWATDLKLIPRSRRIELAKPDLSRSTATAPTPWRGSQWLGQSDVIMIH